VLIVIAAVAAIVSAVANIALAATGERSWAEAGLAIAGAALSVIGLGGAAKAAMGLSKAIAKGAFKGGVKQGMKNAWCKFRFGACFTAGTMIRTADGEKPIEEIQVEDKVWARNVATGRDELRVVEETFVRHTTALHHLTIAGALLTTTAEHPFMVHERGWTAAADLRPGDRLVTANGHVVLDHVDLEARSETVYNFRVATDHTYYVLAGDVPVLVHNSGGYSEPVQNILDALSHGVDSANPIGDGTALAAANNEVRTGQLTNGIDHVASTTQYRNRLVKMRDGIPIGKTRRTAQVIELTEVDKPAVKGMISAIDDAHAGQYKGRLSAYGIGGCK
jgi:hypothetical protein